jgi:BirA family biotin operon repressor/biotin-[acetyl-CoA-carboxylase] ligase
MKKTFLESSTSTNDVARTLGEKGERELVVVAKKQRRGRGRNDRLWISDAGGLYSSFVVKKNRFLPLIAAVSAAETVEHLIDMNEVEIKWPNDIMIRERKVCGILCEGCRDFDIAGIGINVNNTVPLESAVSLREFVKRELSIEDVLDSLISGMERNLLRSGAEIAEEYRKRCRMLGNRVRVQLKDGFIEGIAEMDEEGYLVVNNTRIGVVEALIVERD